MRVALASRKSFDMQADSRAQKIQFNAHLALHIFLEVRAVAAEMKQGKVPTTMRQS